jgi:hypothetical protein
MGGVAGHGDELSIVGWEFTDDFFLKVLEAITMETPNGEWEDEIDTS